MAKQPKADEPRRVESQARMVVADQAPTPQEPMMKFEADPSVTEDEVQFRHDDGRVDRITNLAVPDKPSHRPMDTAPLDGTMINLIAADGSEVRVVWRRTSRYNSATCRWEPMGFWSSPMNRVPVQVDPVGWSLGDGFLMPGAVMA